MKAEGLKDLRERLGLTQDALAEALNAPLGRRYIANTISRWETGNRSIPADVSAFLDAIALNDALPEPGSVPVEGVAPERGNQVRREDTAPTDSLGSVPFSSSGAYKKACTELWGIVASGVGMAGAATGNMRLMQDGALIDADKVMLGDAWGKLAETNETFRNMLIGMTSGGAWMQVALVTGTTVGKIWQNHAQPGEVENGAYADALPGDEAQEPAYAA
jgi:transcriptional regulator with XRE-family HTH domain